MRRQILFSLLATILGVQTAFAADAVADGQIEAMAVTAVAAAEVQAGALAAPRLILPTTEAVAASASQDSPIVRPVPQAIRKGFDARRPLLISLYGVGAGLQAYDGYSTLTALQKFEGASEGNALMRSIAQKPGAFLATKAATAAASIAISEMLWRKDHKVLAVTTMLISNSIMATVAAKNTAVLGELGRRQQ